MPSVVKPLQGMRLSPATSNTLARVGRAKGMGEEEEKERRRKKKRKKIASVLLGRVS